MVTVKLYYYTNRVLTALAVLMWFCRPGLNKHLNRRERSSAALFRQLLHVLGLQARARLRRYGNRRVLRHNSPPSTCFSSSWHRASARIISLLFPFYTSISQRWYKPPVQHGITAMERYTAVPPAAGAVYPPCKLNNLDDVAHLPPICVSVMPALRSTNERTGSRLRCGHGQRSVPRTISAVVRDVIPYSGMR